jgi:hypothetical protein
MAQRAARDNHHERRDSKLKDGGSYARGGGPSGTAIQLVTTERKLAVTPDVAGGVKGLDEVVKTHAWPSNATTATVSESGKPLRQWQVDFDAAG